MPPSDGERLATVEEKCKNLELFSLEVKADIKDLKVLVSTSFAEVNKKLEALPRLEQLPQPTSDWKRLVIFGLAIGAGVAGGGTGVWKIAEVLAKGL